MQAMQFISKLAFLALIHSIRQRFLQKFTFHFNDATDKEAQICCNFWLF